MVWHCPMSLLKSSLLTLITRGYSLKCGLLPRTPCLSLSWELAWYDCEAKWGEKPCCYLVWNSTTVLIQLPVTWPLHILRADFTVCIKGIQGSSLDIGPQAPRRCWSMSRVCLKFIGWFPCMVLILINEDFSEVGLDPLQNYWLFMSQTVAILASVQSFTSYTFN